MHTDARGYPMTTDSADAAAALNEAIGGFVGWKAAVMPGLKAAVEADPAFGFAHAVGGLVLHGARNAGYQPKIAKSLAAAKAAAPRSSERERLYTSALEASARGDIAGAVACYETILAAHPTDLLAERLCQMELFWMGEMAWSEAVSARAAAHWDESVPGYGLHLACRAFDLEETHRFDEAERLGRRAVELDPSDVWGTHAVAHVLIMQGRHDEGIDWLDALKDNWADANQMQLHLWWHRCLFHLERGELDEVLGIYDAWVRNRALPLLEAVPDLYIDLQNGASLLLRLELRGVDVGARWDELAAIALERLHDHTSPFTSAHYAVILAAAGRFEEAGTLLESMRTFAHESDGTLAPRYAVAAIPAAEAAIAHRRGEHRRVVELLLPARNMLWQMGGSHAQRDLFFLLLADSARVLGRRDVHGMVLDDVERAGFISPAARAGYSE
ncbi:MAG: tetratricopeptide repeat protein [Gammaproteobacteria bacterium]|nr:tetratricopeptide repeat protein [Gammaproteobacteria bacterium]